MPIQRGDVVLDPALHAPTDRIDATLRVLPSEPKPVDAVVAGAAASRARRRSAPVSSCSATNRSHPAREAPVQLVLDRPIAAAAGDRYVLRDTSAQRTIGGGRFLDLRAPARKRRTPERMVAARCVCASTILSGARRAVRDAPHTMSISTRSPATARSAPTMSSVSRSRSDLFGSRCRRHVAAVFARDVGRRLKAGVREQLACISRRQSRFARDRHGAAAAAASAALAGAVIRRSSARLARRRRSRSTALGCGCRAMKCA